jgi:hypothetical protein
MGDSAISKVTFAAVQESWPEMASGDNWSVAEVQVTVSDYMEMLMLQLAGQNYSKAEHRRELLAKLSSRSHGAVELKHQNISAVLNELGLFWIPGYKPRGNYQQMLAEEVVAWLERHPEFDRHAISATESPVVTPPHVDFSRFEEKIPERRSRSYSVQESTKGVVSGARGIFRDYLAREARNMFLGRAGEELVLRFEQERLSRAGQERLAAQVEHSARVRGDGLGFDVLSYEISGQERFIEVKTTSFAKETPFFATAAEVEFARRNANQFNVYRLFQFKSDPKYFVLPGAIEQHCYLDPQSFRCGFK